MPKNIKSFHILQGNLTTMNFAKKVEGRTSFQTKVLNSVTAKEGRNAGYRHMLTGQLGHQGNDQSSNFPLVRLQHLGRMVVV